MKQNEVTSIPSIITVRALQTAHASAVEDLKKELSEEAAKAMMDVIFAEVNKNETRPKTQQH